MCRATGIRISSIRTAAISSVTMNRVIWTADDRDLGRSIFQLVRGRRPPGQLQGRMVDHVAEGAVCCHGRALALVWKDRFSGRSGYGRPPPSAGSVPRRSGSVGSSRVGESPGSARRPPSVARRPGRVRRASRRTCIIPTANPSTAPITVNQGSSSTSGRRHAPAAAAGQNSRPIGRDPRGPLHAHRQDRARTPDRSSRIDLPRRRLHARTTPGQHPPRAARSATGSNTASMGVSASRPSDARTFIPAPMPCQLPTGPVREIFHKVGRLSRSVRVRALSGCAGRGRRADAALVTECRLSGARTL